MKRSPAFSPNAFSVETDSKENAELSVELPDAIVAKRGALSLEEGARKLARRPAREKGKAVLDPFVYTAYARKGWMVPNQYWTPGALSPMPIMGKYCMYCGNEFMPPRKLGRINAQRFRDELILATASRINSRNSSTFWESERNADLVSTFLRRHRDVEGDTDKGLGAWIDRFETDKSEAGLDFWYGVHKGAHEVLREF